MKLYAVPRSPFAARVQAALALKGLEVEVAPPPGEGLRSPGYLAVNPMGKLPTLVLDDGRTLPESEVIVEYLEHVYPEPALLPGDPWERARSRLVARVAELYVMAPLFALFRYLADRDAAEVDRLFAEVGSGLRHLEDLIGDEGYAWGREATLADCAVAPFLFWVKMLPQMFGRASLIEDLPKLSRYDEAMQGHHVFGPLLTQMAEDLEALRSASRSR